MHFEAALNLLWIALGLIALAATARATVKRRRECISGQAIFPVKRCGRSVSAPMSLIGICLVVLTLFPYISATDDMVRIEHFCAQTGCHHTNFPGKNDQTTTLIRLYQTMETSVVCAIPEISLVFYFIGLVFTPVSHAISRIQPREAGRSPPAFA